MKLSTVIVWLVFGASVVASAEPARVETSGRVGYKDGHDALQPEPGPWALLATPTPASHGTELVMIGKDAGPISQLRLDAHGLVIVLRVKVYFEDGTHRTFELDRRLGPHRPSTLVELASPKVIDRVAVTTETYTRGSYKLYGSSTDRPERRSREAAPSS